ncbi:ABC-2 family transporter protein [bacterium]|nr:ABC-2 family transporter protein [bacterium]
MLSHARYQFSFLLATAKLGFATYLAYPAGVAMVFVSYPIVILMYRYVFSAVYAHGNEIAGYDLAAILTYVTVSWILNTFYMTPTGRTLGQRVRDGQVAMDLIKPVNLMAIYFGQSLGRTAFRAIFATLPLLFLFIFLADLLPPPRANILPFALAVVCGYLINFQLDYMIGMVAFYFGYNNGIRWGIRMVMGIVGGLVIPLNFFPATLAKVFSFFPTQYMFFQPLQIYLGRVQAEEAWLVVGNGLAWVAGLLILAQLMQADGTRRLSLSGG